MGFQPCLRCKRHIRTRERVCPFCKLTVGALLCMAGALAACETRTTTGSSASSSAGLSAAARSVAPSGSSSAAVEADLSAKRKELEEEQRRLREQVDMYGMPPPLPRSAQPSAAPRVDPTPCRCDKADPLCACN